MTSHNDTLDQQTLEQISHVHYSPYGLPEQTDYVLESWCFGWSNDRVDHMQVQLKYVTQDAAKQVWLISRDPQEWPLMEPYERAQFPREHFQGQSVNLLYDVLVPQLANPDEDHMALAEQLHRTVSLMLSSLELHPRQFYQLVYAPYKLWLTYDDTHSVPFAAVGMGYTEDEFKALLETVVPIDLHNPQIRNRLMRQMSVRYEQRQAQRRDD